MNGWWYATEIGHSWGIFKLWEMTEDLYSDLYRVYSNLGTCAGMLLSYYLHISCQSASIVIYYPRTSILKQKLHFHIIGVFLMETINLSFWFPFSFFSFSVICHGRVSVQFLINKVIYFRWYSGTNRFRYFHGTSVEHIWNINFQYLLFTSWHTRQTATFVQYHGESVPKEKSQ